MRKVVLNLAVSLDGFIEGPNGEYDWCFADQDYGMSAFFEASDAVFMGRKSYELIASSGNVNAFPELKKYIFSDTLQDIAMPGAEIVRRKDFAERISNIKLQDGKNIWLFGGADLISAFIAHDLIDEYMLSVHPVVLGAGKPLFTDISKRFALMHINTQTYNTGLVQIRYVPMRVAAEMRDHTK